MIELWWVLAALAVFQAGDAAACWKPIPYIARCLTDVRFPQRYWRVIPLVKAAAAAGLAIGIVVPWLALLTCVALVCYFAIAVGMHVRAQDLGLNFAAATGFLLLYAAVAIAAGLNL